MGTTFSSLRIRNYRYYFAGQATSLVGTWMQSTAQAWLVLKLTGSGVDLGLVVAFQTLPILLLGPVGGTIADRFGKYRILFWTQALAGTQALVLGVLVLSGEVRLWMVFVLAVTLGLINMVDNPTRQTFVGEMVGRDQLRNAVTLNSVMVNLARAVGPAIAGVLIAGVGIGWCFVINSFSFVFVLAGLEAMHADELMPAPRPERAKGQLLEGFRYVARTPVLRDSLLMMGLVGCLAYEFQVTLPLMARYTFHGTSETYGAMTAFMGIGAVVGGLVAAGRARGGQRRLVGTAVIFGAVLVLAAIAPTSMTEKVALLFVGACSITFLSLGNSTLQLESEPAMRGRVMSLWSVAFMGSTPIGGPTVGWVGAHAGPRWGLGVGAAAALLAGTLGYLSLRRGRRRRGAGVSATTDDRSLTDADVPALVPPPPALVPPPGASEKSAAPTAIPAGGMASNGIGGARGDPASL
ncbi:MAG TPA: MFS transporter [Acidimicrobiales bacterium]|nr:MFS transporter [Acidimicrobiales bacterium]